MMKSDLSLLNHPLIAVDQVQKKPQSVHIRDQLKTIYKFQGKFLMAAGRCPHRGMLLSHAKVCEKGHLVCPYHGKKSLPENELFEKFGFLWQREPSDFFKEVPSDFLFCGHKSVVLNAPFHVVLDNFNEGSHTPFVHRFLGPDIADVPNVSFHWEPKPDHVLISYKSLQKKNILFYGLKRNRDIYWDIHWKTYTDPLYMQYYSEWTDSRTQEKIIEKNMTFFFLVPKPNQQTEIMSFVFVKPLSWMKHFSFLVKKISLIMTTNQILEDQRFYKKINDLPKSLDGLKLDQFDQPLLEIRRRANHYFDYLE